MSRTEGGCASAMSVRVAPPHRAGTVAAIIASCVLLVGAAPNGTTGVGEPVAVSAPDLSVAEFSAATGPSDPSLMVASAIDNDAPGPETHCAVYVSRSGGSKWSEVPAWPTGPNFGPVYDPWVDVGVDGRLHASCIYLTRFGPRVGYVQSEDQGRTWTEPSLVTPLPGSFHRQSADKSALEVASDGTIYACFTQVISPQQLQRTLAVSRSEDQGNTWITQDTGISGFCNGLAATADGVVTVAFLGNGLQYGTVASTDDGDTWSPPVMLGEMWAGSLELPSIVRDGGGRTIVGEVAGPGSPRLEISVEDNAGELIRQYALARPPSSTCDTGRFIQPAVTAPPAGSAAFQVACKIDPTEDLPGRQEVWLYTDISPGSATPPVQVTGFDIPPFDGPPTPFVRRFPDGGDYWELTWKAGGWLSMWIDPRTGGGPGVLMAAPVMSG